MAFIFHSIWDVILPIDFHIFQRGRYTTNQINDPTCFGHITNLTQLYNARGTVTYWCPKYTRSTAEDGGGSFKNRKPIGEIGCCESRMAERIHWWTERCLECRLIHLSIYLFIHPSIHPSIHLSIFLFCLLICQPIHLSAFPSICLALYLSMQPSIEFLSMCPSVDLSF